MAKLELIAGIPRMATEAGAPTIYDQTLELVASGPGAGQILGPINSGTPVTLPSSRTYSANELEIYIGPDRLTPILDYTFTSTTSVTFTFQLIVGDIIRFRIDRAP